jgi:acetyl coenzyme A synthetase (ADP forming)-like protein
MSIAPFFNAQTIAVIGASRERGKIGNVVFTNFLRPGFSGKVYPVNPNADEILGRKCYAAVKDIPDAVELAVIAVPAPFVPKVLDDCGKNGIRHAVIITSGFRESGNQKLDDELRKALERNKILAVGPNCLGVYNGANGMDTLFLPPDRLLRPKLGGISFISQSGALSSAALDLAAQEGYGFAKFVSYGNALNVDESDYLEYFAQDDATKVICMYVEGVHDGRKFLAAATAAAKKKPVIVLKGGVTAAGSKATLSHTGSLAGAAEVYLGAFRQAGLIVANDLEEVFDYLKIFEKLRVMPKGSADRGSAGPRSQARVGNRVQVITNGGGYGIITADEIVQAKHIQMAVLDDGTIKSLKKQFPPFAAIGNPLDVLGDANAERYKLAIDASLRDKNVDILLVVILPQTPLLELETLAKQTIEQARTAKKPLVAIVTGSEFAVRFARRLEDQGIPCYEFPVRAVRALDALAARQKT